MIQKIARQLGIHVPTTLGMGHRRRSAVAKRGEELLDQLDPPFRAALLSMYRSEPQLGADALLHAMDPITRISPSQGMWLYDLCLATKPKAMLEIGMAYGFSTLYFLAAMARNRMGHHTAIDPFQLSTWHGIGLTHAKALAPTGDQAPNFRFIEDRSERVATDLARANASFDLIFIDGTHLFDGVLADFYLYAPLCAMGGRIIFDDNWMSSVRTALAFVCANRSDFTEIPASESNVRVLQRVSTDKRPWDHFREFAVSLPNKK